MEKYEPLAARLYLPTLGRFTSIDPVPGGTANAYVYALDPINFNDYSGMCILQCTASVSFFQPAAAVSRVQPTVSAARVQRVYATTVTIRAASVIIRAAAKPKSSPIKLPAATIKSIDLSAIRTPKLKAGGPASLPMVQKKSIFDGVWSMGEAAAKGCGAAIGVIGVTAGGAMMVAGGATAGASLLPSVGVFATGCLSGGVGGGLIHLVTGSDGEEYDTSGMYDSYDFLNKRLR